MGTREKKGVTRKHYESPTLKVFGDLEELTKTGLTHTGGDFQTYFRGGEEVNGSVIHYPPGLGE